MNGCPSFYAADQGASGHGVLHLLLQLQSRGGSAARVPSRGAVIVPREREANAVAVGHRGTMPSYTIG
jgi:hypothetical protein